MSSDSVGKGNGGRAVETILVLHPDPRLCELLQLTLASAGYDIRVAADAEEALSQFRRANPDLCLADLALITREGSVFCETLQGKRSGRRIPMIVISDLSPPETARQGMAIGADDFLVRPFSPPELLLRTRQSLNRLSEARSLSRAREDLDGILRRTQEELEELRHRVRSQKGGLQSLLDFNRRLDPAEDQSDLERLCLTQAALLGHTAGVCLFRRPSDESGWLMPVRWQGVTTERLRGLRLPLAGEFLEILGSAANPVRLAEFDQVPGTSFEAGTLSAAGFTIAAPLVLRGDLVGLLALGETGANGNGNGHGNGHGPGSNGSTPDMDAIGLLAGSIAHLLEAARLREGERDVAVQTLGAFVDRLECQYPHLVGHSRRVTQMAMAAGKRLALPTADLEVIRVAGHLHDIGRLLTDTDILVRPGPLSPEDWERVHRHPAEGARLAAEARWPDRVQQAILHHRERWSGGGYPAGLKRDAIPMPARLIGVADSLDAMTSPRPYREPIPDREARRVLLRESGESFDPVVVEAVLSLDQHESDFEATGS